MADILIGPEVIFKMFNKKPSMGTGQSEQMLVIRLDHFWCFEDAGVAGTAGPRLIILDTVRVFQYFNNWCGGCMCEPLQRLSQLKGAMLFCDCPYSITEGF